MATQQTDERRLVTKNMIHLRTVYTQHTPDYLYSNAAVYHDVLARNTLTHHEILDLLRHILRRGRLLQRRLRLGGLDLRLGKSLAPVTSLDVSKNFAKSPPKKEEKILTTPSSSTPD